MGEARRSKKRKRTSYLSNVGGIKITWGKSGLCRKYRKSIQLSRIIFPGSSRAVNVCCCVTSGQLVSHFPELTFHVYVGGRNSPGVWTDPELGMYARSRRPRSKSCGAAEVRCAQRALHRCRRPAGPRSTRQYLTKYRGIRFCCLSAFVCRPRAVPVHNGAYTAQVSATPHSCELLYGIANATTLN